MDELIDALTAVVSRHNPCSSAAQGDWDNGEIDCLCGQVMPNDDWPAHVANAVMLGMTTFSESRESVLSAQKAIDNHNRR